MLAVSISSGDSAGKCSECFPTFPSEVGKPGDPGVFPAPHPTHTPSRGVGKWGTGVRKVGKSARRNVSTALSRRLGTCHQPAEPPHPLTARQARYEARRLTSARAERISDISLPTLHEPPQPRLRAIVFEASNVVAFVNLSTDRQPSRAKDLRVVPTRCCCVPTARNRWGLERVRHFPIQIRDSRIGESLIPYVMCMTEGKDCSSLQPGFA